MSEAWRSDVEETTVVGVSASSRPAGPLDETPARVGRYRIGDRLGRGGMATVVLGHDETLDREVALKLVRVPATRPRQRARVLREAQSMARLHHPNVVPVFDVGVHEDLVFIAMERVQGGDLTRWLAEAPRSTAAILDKFVQAGRGLAAVHDQGLVHRDFKPHNVVVGDDGRVRLIDFGLAKGGDDGPATHESWGASMNGRASRSSSSMEVGLTEDGLVVGTPAYMSPEQIRGETLTPASDQFSFCVSLFEACFGQRPFSGPTFEKLSRNIVAGRVDPFDERRAPRWLGRVLRRGLAADPARRWPDMASLVAALEAGARRPRRWLTGGALGGLALSLLALAGRGDPACEEDGGAAGWDDADRAQARAGILATGVPYAEDTWTRVDATVGQYAAELRDRQLEVCTTRDEVAPSEFDARMACLSRRDDALAELVEELERATLQSVETATNASSRLEPPETCLDPAERETTGWDRTSDPAVQDLRAVLTQARALRRDNDFDAAVRTASTVWRRAEALGLDWLVARAALEVAHAHNAADRYEEAATAFETAYHRASSAGEDLISGQAAIQMANGMVRRSKFDEAQRWITHAKLALHRVGDPARTVSGLLDNEARLYYRMGRYEDAAATYEEALKWRARGFGPRSSPLAHTLDHFGSTLRALGKLEEALSRHQEALTILEDLHGPHHPEVGRAQGNFGHALSRLGRREDALAAYDRAFEILSGAFGPEHSDLGAILSSRGAVYLSMGDLQRARADLERSLEIEQLHAVPDDPSTGIAHNNLGNVELEARNFDAAEYHYRRAYELYAAGWGTSHPFAAVAYLNLARVAGAKGDHELGVERYTEGLERIIAAYPAGHINEGMARNNLAGELSALGRLDEAERELLSAREIMRAQLLESDGRRALPDHELAEISMAREDYPAVIERLDPVLELWAIDAPNEHVHAHARFMVAKALHALQDPRSDRARTLLEAATAHFAEHPDEELLAESRRLRRELARP